MMVRFHPGGQFCSVNLFFNIRIRYTDHMESTRQQRFIAHITKSWKIWSSLNMETTSAGLAYYAIFSIAPLLIIAISVAGLFLDSTTVTHHIISQLSTTFGDNSAHFIQSLLNDSASAQTNITMSVIGAIIIIIGAANIFSQLRIGLDKVFAHQPARNKQGFWTATVRKILSVGVVILAGILLLISLLMTTVITTLANQVVALLPEAEFLLYAIELAISLVLVSLFFAGMYKYLPSKKIGWKPAVVAGFFSGILFFATKTILGFILVSDTAFSSFGGASALVLLIVWIYIMSQLFFMGAFIARLYLLPRV